MERIRCPNPKCGRHILDIEQMPPGETVMENQQFIKTVNKSDTYILASVLRFTVNVDCSAPAVFIYGSQDAAFLGREGTT